jgi:primosomal protein N'
MPAYAGIHLIDAPYCIDNAFDYYIPPNLRRDILCGDFVTVPFGVSNNAKMGLVVSLKEQPDNKGIDHKSIIDICDRSMSLSEEALGLCSYLKEQTLCTVGDAVRAIFPVSAFSRMENVYYANEGADLSSLDATALFIYEHIKKREGASAGSLKAKFGPATEPSLKKLVAAGALRRDFTVKSVSEKTEEFCSLTISVQRAEAIVRGEDTLKLRSKKHAELLG